MDLPQEFRIEDLDDIRIMTDGGQVGACFGLMFTFYFKKTHEKAVRHKMCACLDRYRELVPGKLTFYLTPRAGRYRKVTKTRPGLIVDDLEKSYSPNNGFSWVFCGGEDYKDAAHYGIGMMCVPDYGTDELGFVSGTLPMSWVAENGPGSFQKLVHQFCATLNPFHGYAGLGILQSMDYDQNRSTKLLILPYAMRFPGLEVENPVSLSNHLEEKIKGVNWLNVLSDGFIDQLGGRQQLKAALDDEFLFFDYEGGSIIQAGPSPQIGDVNRQLIPPHYKKLAAVLKPIRVDYPDSYLRAPDFSDNKAVTQKWFNRFD